MKKGTDIIAEFPEEEIIPEVKAKKKKPKVKTVKMRVLKLKALTQKGKIQFEDNYALIPEKMVNILLRKQIVKRI